MSIYSGFATRQQQETYDRYLEAVVQVLQKRLIKFYEGQQTNEQKFLAILAKLYSQMRNMEKQKYSMKKCISYYQQLDPRNEIKPLQHKLNFSSIATELTHQNQNGFRIGKPSTKKEDCQQKQSSKEKPHQKDKRQAQTVHKSKRIKAEADRNQIRNAKAKTKLIKNKPIKIKASININIRATIRVRTKAKTKIRKKLDKQRIRALTNRHPMLLKGISRVRKSGVRSRNSNSQISQLLKFLQ